jgi:hypothetical protein
MLLFPSVELSGVLNLCRDETNDGSKSGAYLRPNGLFDVLDALGGDDNNEDE